MFLIQRRLESDAKQGPTCLEASSQGRPAEFTNPFLIGESLPLVAF